MLIPLLWVGPQTRCWWGQLGLPAQGVAAAAGGAGGVAKGVAEGVAGEVAGVLLGVRGSGPRPKAALLLSATS